MNPDFELDCYRMGDDREARLATLVGHRQALGLLGDAVTDGASKPAVRARAATSAFEVASLEPALLRDDGARETARD